MNLWPRDEFQDEYQDEMRSRDLDPDNDDDCDAYVDQKNRENCDAGVPENEGAFHYINNEEWERFGGWGREEKW